jgi:hypothetical protein
MADVGPRAAATSRAEASSARSWCSGRPHALLGIVLAVAVRFYLHVFYIPDQDWFPTMAMHSVAAGDWRPEMLVYPSALLYTLRVAYGRLPRAPLGGSPTGSTS